MYSHVACDVMKERTLYLLKPSSLIWHLMPYLFLLNFLVTAVKAAPHECVIRTGLLQTQVKAKNEL